MVASTYKEEEEKLGICSTIFLVFNRRSTQSISQTPVQILTTDKKKAEHLNKHFATVTKSNKKSDFDRTLKQDLRKEELSNERSTPEIFMTNITAGEL